MANLEASIATCPACGAHAEIYRRARCWPREVAALVCVACAEATEALVAGLGSEAK